MDLMAWFPREHRLKGFLFDYPSVMLTIILVYIIGVTKIGPALMRDRKPFDLRNVKRLQNLIQVRHSC